MDLQMYWRLMKMVKPLSVLMGWPDQAAHETRGEKMTLWLGAASLERSHLNEMSNAWGLLWISLLPPLLNGDNVSAELTPNLITGRDVWRARSVEADQDPLKVGGFLVCSFFSPWLC
jgi:hypothetical protein